MAVVTAEVQEVNLVELEFLVKEITVALEHWRIAVQAVVAVLAQ